MSFFDIMVVYSGLCIIFGCFHAIAFLQDFDPYPSLVMGLVFTIGAPLFLTINLACALGSLLRVKPRVTEAGEMLLGASFGIISLILENIASTR